MPESNVKQLVPAIAAAVADITGLPKPTTPLSPSNRCALWAHASNDNFTPVDGDGNAAAFTIFRAFVARPAGTARNRVAIQASTWGPTAADAIAQSEQVFNAMLDGAGTDRVPRREWAIAGFVISIYRLVFGGIVAADQHGATCVFNFEAAHRAAAGN